MIGIQKTVTIPENRRISVDLFGRAFPSIEELKRQGAEKTALRKAEGRKPFGNLCGVLKDSPALSGDPAEMARAWRDEWETAR
ncbi:MAG: hypothetical protein LBD55_04065 [Treponema sp.]|jgi:hypothetical protein|nr:hypothetical protein [Treponema sp.]